MTPIDRPTTTMHTTPGLWDGVLLVARDIKLSHSVFALPFALLAAFLAASGVPRGSTLGLIVLCMVLARIVAMTMNRWADAGLDTLNPRTAGRAVPRGALRPSFLVWTALVAGAVFIIATAGFWVLDGNRWPLVLSPLVLGWLIGYSFTKRFTWLCHLCLGSALALSPLAAAIAVEPAYLARVPPYLLAGMVLSWVAGFDVIYALQDIEVDQAQGLYSMPANLGVGPALWASRVLHLASIVLLILLWRASPMLEGYFALGIVLVAALLVLEHVLVWGSRTHHIHIAFFTVNGIISIVLCGLGIWDVMGW